MQNTRVNLLWETERTVELYANLEIVELGVNSSHRGGMGVTGGGGCGKAGQMLLTEGGLPPPQCGTWEAVDKSSSHPLRHPWPFSY